MRAGVRILNADGPTTLIEVTCSICGDKITFTAPTKGMDQWRSGTLIQHALPTLSPAERELLISQTCDPCFDEMFGTDEGAKL